MFKQHLLTFLFVYFEFNFGVVRVSNVTIIKPWTGERQEEPLRV